MEDVSEGRISTIEMRSHLQRCVKTRDCGAPPFFLIMLKHPSWNSSFKSIPWNVFKCIFNFDGGYPVHIRRIFVGYPPSGYHVTNSRINQKWTFFYSLNKIRYKGILRYVNKDYDQTAPIPISFLGNIPRASFTFRHLPTIAFPGNNGGLYCTSSDQAKGIRDNIA